MRWRNHGQGVSGIEQAAEEQRIADAGKYDLHVALREPVADACPAVLDEAHLDAGMLAAEAGDEGRKDRLDVLRTGSYPQGPGEPALERVGAVPQSVRFLQQTAPAAHDVLALGGE